MSDDEPGVRVFALARDGNYYDSVEMLQRELVPRVKKEEECFRIMVEFVKTINRFSEDFAFLACRRLHSTSTSSAHRAYFAAIAYGAALRIADFNPGDGQRDLREQYYGVALEELDSHRGKEE